MKPDSNDNNACTPEGKTKRAQQACTTGLTPESDPLAIFKAMMEQHYKSTDPHSKFEAMLAEMGIDSDSDPLALFKAMMEQHYKSADPHSKFKAKLAAAGIAPDKDIVQEQFAQIIALLDPKREFIDMLSDRPTARSLLHAWFTKSSKSADPNDIAEAKALLAEAGIDPDSTTFDEFLEQYYKSRAPHSAPEKDTDPDIPKD